MTRDAFTDMDYLGVRELDGYKFHQFYTSIELFDIGVDYLTDMSGDLKPRRFGIGYAPDNDVLYIDNYLNSYSDKFNSTTVFQIPKYCQDS